MTAAPITGAARPSRPLAWLQPAVVTGGLVPFFVLAIRALRGGLGANPIATALNQLGLLALVFLMACLACTPLKAFTGQNWPIRIRRTLGLFAFFTALTHFLVYVILDQTLALNRIVADIVKRPFIALGFSALVVLVPLALTSSKRAVQRLGFKRWKRLHRLVYLAGVLAVIHFVLRVKADLTEPLLYGALLTLLFAARVFDRSTARQKS